MLQMKVYNIIILSRWNGRNDGIFAIPFVIWSLSVRNFINVANKATFSESIEIKRKVYYGSSKQPSWISVILSMLQSEQIIVPEFITDWCTINHNTQWFLVEYYRDSSDLRSSNKKKNRKNYNFIAKETNCTTISKILERKFKNILKIRFNICAIANNVYAVGKHCSRNKNVKQRDKYQQKHGRNMEKKFQ